MNIPTVSVHGMDGMSSQEVIYQIIKIGIDRILMPDFGEEVSFVQQIINSACKYGRKVVVEGRSMVNIIQVAQELGLGLSAAKSRLARVRKRLKELLTREGGEPYAKPHP